MTERVHSKKEFKKKLDWLVEHRHSISRTRLSWYLNGMEERYSDFVPYGKYVRFGEGMKEYFSDKVSKFLRKEEKNEKTSKHSKNCRTDPDRRC